MNCSSCNQPLPPQSKFCPACGSPAYLMGGHDYTELILDRTRDFTGREWVLAQIDAWLANPDGHRLFFLGGGPGSGKSAMAARLVQLARGEVPAVACPHLAQAGLAYYHFCQAQYNAVIEPVGFVKSLSLALADRYPAFAQALAQIGQSHPEFHVQQTVGQATGGVITGVKIETLEVGGLSARKAFAHLVSEPLKLLAQSGESGPILVLVDALDEALTFDLDDNLVTLLADVTDDPRDLPKQVRFLVTGRPDPRVVDLIGEPALDLVVNAPDSQHDVQDYAEHRLAPVLAQPVARQDLAGRIAIAGAGNFLYARYVLDELAADPHALADPATLILPEGLDGVYEKFLKRELGRQGRTWRTYRPLFGALVMARGSGLTRKQLAGIMDARDSAVEELLEPCMQYLAGAFPDGPFRIYHQSFREFLMKSQVYRLEPDEVRADVARYFWVQYTASRDKSTPLDDYTLANLPVHLAEAGRQADLKVLLLDFDWLSARLERADIYSILADFDLAQLDVSESGNHDINDSLCLIKYTLRLTSHLIAADRTQLGIQLVGRLQAVALSPLQDLLATIRTILPAEAIAQLPSPDDLRGRTLAGHNDAVTGLALTKDGRNALSCSKDGYLKIWNVEYDPPFPRHTLESKDGALLSLWVDPTGTRAITGSDQGALAEWNLESGRISRILYRQVNPIRAVAATPDGKRAVFTKDEHSLQILDLDTLSPVATLYDQDAGASAVALTLDGQRVVVGGIYDWLSVWDVASGKKVFQLAHGRDSWVTQVAVATHAPLALSGAGDGSVKLWDLTDGRPLWRLGLHQVYDKEDHGFYYEKRVTALAITPDGQWALSAGEDACIVSIDVINGSVRHRLQLPDANVVRITLTPGGDRALSATSDHRLQVWNLVDGEIRYPEPNLHRRREND